MEFLEGELNIDRSRISATYFSGDKDLDVGADSVSLTELNNYFSKEKIVAEVLINPPEAISTVSPATR